MQNMRFILNSALVLLLAYGNFVYNVVQGRSLADIKKSGVLRVAVDGNTPGFNYHDKGKLTGLEVDLTQLIADRMDLKVEWTVQPFNTLLIGIKQDRFDLIADSHTITPQRMQIVDFIKPHYCTGAYIITKPGGPLTAAELNGKVVAVAVGTVYYDKLTTIPNIKKIMTVPSESDGLLALVNDRADAWVAQRAIAEHGNASLPQKTELVFGEMILPQTNAFVVAKGNAELKSAIDAELESIIQDGTYAKLIPHYISEDICCK
jgi:polar amino acid transport system substrate-binding protein